MIFKETYQQVLDGTKTQTRRPVNWAKHHAELDAEENIMAVSQQVSDWDHKTGDWRWKSLWKVGSTYAVQPGRGKKAVGRIRITKIRREPLQDMSWEDMEAEGIERREVWVPAMKTDFVALWNSLCRKPYRWEDNPEVWVLEFERVETCDATLD